MKIEYGKIEDDTMAKSSGCNDGNHEDDDGINTEDEILSHTFPLFTYLQMFALSCIFAGVQFVWTLEMGYGTPYLLSFGMSKSSLTLAWLAGPLSGLLMQPIIGAFSDRSSSRMGRRRPYMILGSVAIVTSVLGIAWIRDISQFLGWENPSATDASFVSTFLAVFGFYILDFSINAVQATSRSLIVDVLPTHQQHIGQAFASVLIAVGNVAGYLAGSLDLVQIMPSFIDTQMKALAFLSSITMVVGVSITCLSTSEDPFMPPFGTDEGSKILRGFRPLLKPWSIPKRLLKVFIVQFFAWFGWFPFSFFTTEYIKELWIKDHSGDEHGGERMGSFALFSFSLVSIAAGLLLPVLIARLRIKLTQLWTFSQLIFGIILFFSGWVNSYLEAIVMVSLLGICMAVSLWVPFALVGSYISAEDDEKKRNDEFTRTEDHITQAGILLGLHNSFIVLPQFLSSFVCSLIFTWRAEDGIIWVWRVSALSSVVASLICAFWRHC